MTQTQETSLDLYVKAVLSRKAQNVVVLDVTDLTSIADVFIICSGRSHRQVTSLSEYIQMDLKKSGIRPINVEGQKQGHWVLIDYGDVIVHIFYEPIRSFYDLESLFNDAKRIEIEESIEDMKMEKNKKGPCVLMILDGWGISEDTKANAVFEANTPFLDSLFNNYPHTKLLTSGEAVGLPDGVMGNSEVGHMNIGAGRIVYQDLLRINKTIKDQTFYQQKILKGVMEKTKEKQKALHLIGLVSDGGVHSHIDHIFALLDMTRKIEMSSVYIHAIMDGRDTPPKSGEKYIRQLQEYIKKTNHGQIGSICGRFYAMDRDRRWERIEKAYELYTQGKGVVETHPVKAIQNAYLRDETDEFILPICLRNPENDTPIAIQDGDSVIFFNFRSDRAREITEALTEPNFSFFKRSFVPKIRDYVCMTMYDKKFPLPVAFPPIGIKNILGEIISEKGLSQFRTAETEKYAHVTYFFNGGEEEPFPREERCLIPSPREVSTYDKKPEMSAKQVTDEFISRLEKKADDFMVINFANMDMVGHTGILEAAIKACETVDKCLEKIVPQVLSRGGTLIITADHGNSEKMVDERGEPHTAHTTNPVPLILVDDLSKSSSLKEGILGDIAPTILEIMGIEKPKEMTGRSLFNK